MAATDVTTHLDHDSVSASALVDASPAAVFDYVRRPANHAAISGTETIKAVMRGPDRLSLGDKFGMQMRIGLPYRVTNKVVEFEPDRRIAWCHMMGHRWRWEVDDAGDGKTRVTETFDLSTARIPPFLRVMGLPKGHEQNVAASVANVAAHFGA